VEEGGERVWKKRLFSSRWSLFALFGLKLLAPARGVLTWRKQTPKGRPPIRFTLRDQARP
jgi:hypothetical protein